MTGMNDDLVSIVSELREINKRLSDSYKEMWKQSIEYAQAEHDYKIALQQRILELKAQDERATLILDLARGTPHVADLKFKRDIAERKYETCKESIRSMRVTATVCQSILKVQFEVEQ